MSIESTDLETLKNILENSLHVERLDSHPWAKSLGVLDMVTDSPGLQELSPGGQLIFFIQKIFIEIMPSTTPRRGKRLDNRWGEFGILAAQYFAPLKFGTPMPDSLRDAWGRIDQSILLFVYGKPDNLLSETEKEDYKVVGDELVVAPNSTISDWHRKGLLRLLNAILARENYLSKSLVKPAVILDEGGPNFQPNILLPVLDDKVQKKKAQKPNSHKFATSLFILVLLGLILIAGLKVLKVYNLVMIVRQDVVQIQELVVKPSSRLERVKAAGLLLFRLKQDFKILKDETEPFFWMGPWLKWVPVYGGDLASIQDLATLADSLLTVSCISYQAVLPLIEQDSLSDITPTRLTELLIQSQPQLLEARQALDQAFAARSNLTPENFSPQIRDLIVNNLDPLMVLAQDGLSVAVEIPRLMGATNEGPKTYLLLVQNEDELRPTGGFITAASTLLMQDGQPTGLFFLNSGDLDNWDRPYPAAPWQLREYMDSPVLIFRDSNWFTNYPTAALYAEYLYSYINSHSVDGVIAFDQHMLVKVLSVTGPVEVEGAPYFINAENVVSYMRASKTPTAEDLLSPDWTNKVFINKLTRALVKKIFSGDISWGPLSAMLLEVLEERHLLIQLDNPMMTSILERYQWDGAVRPASYDFLMVVDSNIGFNKTNAVVDSNLSYEVNLTNPSFPTALLTVFHKNNADEITFCKHWNKTRVESEQDYPITDCYWNYLRVYTKDGTKLINATPQFVPDNWMIIKQKNPGQVDILEEEIDGVQAFGTLQVLPGGQSLSTSFEFVLPVDILSVEPNSNQMAYRLKVQKQPGTEAVLISIRVRLPTNARIETSTEGTIAQDENALYQVNLRTDIEFEIIFTLP